MDALENSNGLTDDSIKRITWDENDNKLQKLDLEIDEHFLLVGNIYGRFDSKHSHNEKDNNNTYMTFTCQQEPIKTVVWRCKSGELINAENVCNAYPDCKDESDEKQSMCKIDIEFVWWITTSVLSLSLVVNLITSIIRFFDKRNSFDEADVEDSNFVTDQEDQQEFEWFLTIQSACEMIVANLENNATDSEILMSHIAPVLDLYRLQHDKDEEHRKNSSNQIFAIIRKVGIDPKFARGADYIIDALHNIEVEELHSGNESEAGDCLKHTLQKNSSNYDYFVSRLERLGSFGKLKQNTKDSLLNSLGRMRLVKTNLIVSAIFTLMLATKDIILYYFDIYFDTAIGLALHKMDTEILTSVRKLRAISFINASIMKYYFPGLGLLSTFFIHVYYITQIKRFSFYRPELLYRLITLISMIFPITFTVMELARSFLIQMKTENKISNLVALKRHSKSQINKNSRMFFKLSRSLNLTIEYGKEIKEILVNSFLIEIIVETIPQAVSILAFLITDFKHNFGYLKTIFMDSLVEGIGLNGPTLSAILITINLVKLSFSPIGICEQRRYPMSIGIPGSIIKIIELSFLLCPKILLAGVITRTKPYLYLAITITEIILITGYTKITQNKMDFFGCVLPATYIPALFNPENTRTKLIFLKKFRGVVNTVIIHFTLLFIVYIPSYFLINQSMPQFREDLLDFKNIDAIGFCLYTFSIIPHLGMVVIYHYFGRRDKELYKRKDKNKNETNQVREQKAQLIESQENINETEQSELNTEAKKLLNPVIYQCPTQPYSFMMKNMPMIEKKLEKISDSTS